MDNQIIQDFNQKMEQTLKVFPLNRDNAPNWLSASRKIRDSLREIERQSKDIIDAHTEEIARNKANRA